MKGRCGASGGDVAAQLQQQRPGGTSQGERPSRGNGGKPATSAEKAATETFDFPNSWYCTFLHVDLLHATYMRVKAACELEASECCACFVRDGWRHLPQFERKT